MPFAVADSMANGKEFRIGFRLNSEAGNERTTDRLARRQRSTLGLHSRREGVGAGGAGGGLKRSEIAKNAAIGKHEERKDGFLPLLPNEQNYTLYLPSSNAPPRSSRIELRTCITQRHIATYKLMDTEWYVREWVVVVVVVVSVVVVLW